MVCLRDHIIWPNYRMFRENISEEWTGIAGLLPSRSLIFQVYLISWMYIHTYMKKIYIYRKYTDIYIIEHFLKVTKAVGWGRWYTRGPCCGNICLSVMRFSESTFLAVRYIFKKVTFCPFPLACVLGMIKLS